MTQPARKHEDGLFPFGRPNGPRPWWWEGSGTPDQLVIGVYPSALHVRWEAPRTIALPEGAAGRVSSLAIDVEPTVFWDGADALERVDRWKEQVGFVDGDDGHGTVAPGLNGPSGAGLDTLYFPALPAPRQRTAFLDVYPVFLVKYGSKKHPGQGRVIKNEYDEVVGQLPAGASGPLMVATLPPRPTPVALPPLAAERFGDWLRGALVELSPAHVVTLGQEPWSTLALLEGVTLAHPAESVSSSRTSGYGRTGSITVDGHRMDWTPLAHPGLVRQSSKKAPDGWRAVHERWLEAGRGTGP